MFLQLGDQHILLCAYDPLSQQYIDQFISAYSAFVVQKAEPIEPIGALTYFIVSNKPLLADQNPPIWMSESEYPTWKEFCYLSNKAFQRFYKARSWAPSIVIDPTDSFFYSWSPLSDVGLPNSGNSKANPSSHYMILIIDEDRNNIAHIKIFSSAVFHAAKWHIERGGLCIHSSALAHTRNDGFLFLGDSGNGKTTVAKIGESIGHVPLGDDLNFISNDEFGRYWLMTAPSPSLSNIHYSMLRPRLKGIFRLVKNSYDQLIPMSPMTTVKALFESVLQIPRSHKLGEKYLRSIFLNCANIARSVPGYELHFRKSPDFWKLIDAEFPD